MARACTICTHPRRIEINHALVESIAPGGPSVREIANRFASSEDALARHLSKHLKPAVARAAQIVATPSESTKPSHDTDPQAIAEAQQAIADEARESRQGGSKLVERVEFLWSEAKDGLRETKAKDHRAHASYIGQARKVAELGGLATGELRRDDPGTQRTVVVVLPPAGLPGVTPRPALEDGDGPVIDLVPTA